MKLQLLLLSILSIKYLDATCDNGVYELGVSKDEKNQIVALHNYLRKQIANGKVKGQPRGVNLKRMSWDESLAEQAQNVANTCEFKHLSINDDRWSWVGQNLFNSMATNYNKKTDWKGVIQNSWFGEKDNYKYRAEYTKNVVHYTQLVWANTNKVGCGYTHFPIEGDFPYKKLYVCNYAPGGNIEGENPYKKGKSGCENLSNKMKFQLFLLALFYVEHLNAVCNEAVHQRAVSESDKKAIVDIHNHFRTLIAQGKVPGQPRGINLKRMKWDENLAREAQKIANTCEFTHKSVQDGRWSWVGQNLYTSSSTNYDTRTDWNGAITAFFNEHKMYKFGSGFSMNTGHYTQVVWAESDHVGCGYTHYENSRSGYRYHKLYVCNYGPGGNIVGQNPYKVGTSGCENLC
nr:uncharacterized protein LOC111421045 [Onthophagus taurus]